MAVPQKTKHRITIWSSNFTSECIPQRNESSLKNILVLHVHNSFIHNSQDMEATQCLINKWMDKENVADSYDEIFII